MIFSDLAHVIVSTLINIVLFIFVKRKMELKRSLLHSNTVMNLIMMSKMKRKKMLRNTTKSKDRISQMVVLNGINFLAFKLPLALLSFYGFVFRYNKDTKTYDPSLISYLICKEKRYCASLQEIFVCFYFISFFFQFFTFSRLDSNFKLCFNNLKKKFSFQVNNSLPSVSIEMTPVHNDLPVNEINNENNQETTHL